MENTVKNLNGRGRGRGCGADRTATPNLLLREQKSSIILEFLAYAKERDEEKGRLWWRQGYENEDGNICPSSLDAIEDDRVGIEEFREKYRPKF